MAYLDMKYVGHELKIIAYWGNLLPFYQYVSTWIFDFFVLVAVFLHIISNPIHLSNSTIKQTCLIL